MYKPLFVFILLILSFNAFSQQATTDTTAEIEDQIFQRVEKEAEFPGGQPAWRAFLESNLNGDIATKKKAPVGKYTVIVQFIVGYDGTISDIKATTNNGYGMEKEVIRVIRKCPKWTPAQQHGRKVRAYRRQPITFEVVNG
jgi:periplasmic protein TonB